MVLSSEDIVKAINAINRLWKGAKRCTVCESTNWNVSPNIFELREFQGGNLDLGGSQLVPLVVLSCTTCSHTMLFNAIKLGVLQPKIDPVIADYIASAKEPQR